MIVTVVISSLAVVISAIVLGGQADAANLTPLFDSDHGLTGTLQSAGLLFFAFAGYARIATLGEEVADPKTTIPRAIPIALGIALFIYSAVAISALMAVGADALAASNAPLTTAVQAGSLDGAAIAVRIGATVASLGVLLSLLAGVSRTLFAMAANRDMPSLLANVHPRYKVPDRAELVVAAVVILVVAFVDLRGAIGFSSFGVLLYYAIANASSFTLPTRERRWPRWLSVAGIVGCLLLAFTLPFGSVLAGGAVILAGCVTFALARAYDRLSNT